MYLCVNDINFAFLCDFDIWFWNYSDISVSFGVFFFIWTEKNEWVSDCCLTPIQQQVNFQWDDDEVRFVLHQHAELDFYRASSLKQQSADRHVAAPLGDIILIPSQPVFPLSA